MDLDPPLVHAPEFTPLTWINAFEPISLAALRGRVVLIDFWDFTCVNCLRGLPYLREWHAEYEDLGLTLIGVHTPEFAFAREVSVVKSAVGRLGIRYPVALDNEQTMWIAYAVGCWPTRILIDTRGYVRAVRQGEGGYNKIEATLQALLRDRDPHVALPELMEAVRPEDARGAVCLPTTPELQVDALAATLSEQNVMELSLPPERPEGRIYASGNWRFHKEGIVIATRPGSLVLPYRAASVNAVLAAAFDPDHSAEPPPAMEILQDGVPLPMDRFGDDVRLDNGRASLVLDMPRLYSLVRNPDSARHELHLDVTQPGLIFYAFSFGTCVVPDAEIVLDPME